MIKLNSMLVAFILLSISSISFATTPYSGTESFVFTETENFVPTGCDRITNAKRAAQQYRQLLDSPVNDAGY